MYTLTVIVSDSHPTHPLSSFVVVIVLIGDINDHWPQFMNSPYVAYVPIELATGTVVCAVRATDEDTEMNAELHYSLYGQWSDLFSIDSYTGTVFTTKELHNTDDIIINVHVEDAGETPKFDFTTISIRFQNMSDFPEMHLDVLSYSLSEDEPARTLVAAVSAASTRAEPVSIYLASGNFEDMFHVDQLRGVLTVENSLDYERKKEFSLLIEARDSGSPPFSSFLEILLNVTDTNDNFPQFTQVEYRCEVFENFPPSGICDVLAIDADSPTYGRVTYSITEGNDENFFTLDHESGLLSTAASLDRETIPVFNLTVEAVEPDNPLHKDRANVIVNVLDRNDNAPRFSHIFLVEVPEDAPVGHTIIQVTSSDDDTDANAVIRYYILDQSEDMLFDIDSTTGYVTVKRPVDREAHDHYVLRVTANDSAWSISTDVTIVISDVNDNTPVFTSLIYTATLPETTDKDVFVLQVLATDADVGKNSEVFYIIDPSNEEFWVNASSGEIYTKQPLLLHNSPFEIHNFTVLAFDCGSVPRYSNATVTVRLEQYNHHPPMFLPLKPLISIPNHLPLGTEVVQLTATDPDVNNSVSIEYHLNGGNGSDFFWIETNSGNVFLNQTLEESENAFLTLFVSAKDKGFPPLTSLTEITFQIIGRNQFSPSFNKPGVTFSVPEDLPVGSVIGKIQAEDMDHGPNGAVMYFINPENHHLPLTVDEVSGLLLLVGELDFEKESIYNFFVTGSDGGWISKSGMINVTVIVMDVNDNPPVFSSSEYTISVPENSEIGTNVFNAKAADKDSGASAEITYSFIAGHVDKFAIDQRNGTITTLDVFDFEREQIFDLTIKASNPGVHTLFGLAHVVVRIVDVNEFAPTFANKEFNFSVFKNVPVGTQIGKVAAVDHDQGSAGQVFYFIFGHGKNMGFGIDQFSGEIYTSGSLRKQGNSRLVLKVLAKNSGVITGMDVDETLVQINVIDTNDAPIFTTPCYDANVTEDSPEGTSVLMVSAVDQDSVLDWNRFFFGIEHGNTNSSFSIDPLTGVISVRSTLDRELWPVYNLTVTATDNGFPPATGTADVIVIVGDVNDNAPKLTSTEAQVKENQPEGTVAARLNASDSDLPPNQGPFTYWLLNPSAGSAFTLAPDGVLLTTQTFDREHISEYQILVAVRDAGFPVPLSSTTTFHIRVVDENDNPPMSRNIFIEVKYFGSSFHGGMIGSVHPEDRDASDTFTCTIRSGSVNMFTIPNATCELWSAPFQGEATFNITIEASDQLHFSVNNSVYVNYKGFTNASVDSCIFFYVLSSSMEEFLSNKYLRFVKALDNLFNLQASKPHVFGIKHIGREILLLAAVKNYNGQYLSREVASGISAGHKRLLEAQSNVTISHITGEPCLTGPCQNGASCNKNVYISPEVAVLESVAVIFVSPQKEVFNCTCLAGFTGSLCEHDIDECEVNPCRNNGTCENTAGSFSCHCLSGFSGSVCSADVDECLEMKCQNGGTCTASQDGFYCQCVPGFKGEMCEEFIDHCSSAPCVQGSCVNFKTGFSCNCPFGVSGVHCEEHSYGFEELSYMEFPPLDRRTNLISFKFATVQRNSLLLYNPAEPSSREFFALEIVNGTIRLSYDLGSGPVRLQTHKQVADGHFHTVAARRIGNMPSSNSANMRQHPLHEWWQISKDIVLQFNGSEYIEYVIKERFRRDHLLKDSVDDDTQGNTRNQTVINIKFKTTDDGVLFFVFGQTGHINLVIRDRRPVYLFKDALSGYLSEEAVATQVADGNWHVISLLSNGGNIFLSVDGKPVLNSTEQSMDLTPAGVDKIILGAAPTRETRRQHSTGFSGCVQYFNITGYALPISGPSVAVEVWPSSTLLRSSCRSPGVCFPSPCSEEDADRKTCFSHCQNQQTCKNTIHNRSCVCLHNVSDHFCDICISTAHDQCSGDQQGSKPLWLIPVVLPLIFILVIIGLCVGLYRLRHTKCQSNTFLQKAERGTTNRAFCFDDNMVFKDDVSSEKGTPHYPKSTDQQKSSVEFYCAGSLSGVQSMPPSELEYFEIGSISSEFHQDNSSLKLNCHNQLYSRNDVKANPKVWRDLRLLLPTFQKGPSAIKKDPQNINTLNKQFLCQQDTEKPQTLTCYTKRFPQPEILEPTQCLSYEEIYKLNAPVEPAVSHQASLQSGPALSTTVMKASAGKDTDGTFTCSESEYGHFSVITGKKYMHDQLLQSDSTLKREALNPISSIVMNTSSTMVEQWGDILNMQLPFSCYVPVFEDIACLPIESNHSCDMQSDIEEII
ncbi:protocadherin Fat 4 [Cololabis saira]|uniref:protocadherin Fat 4 n=1 Tax=Cololabis saira TaxID=129043 RepID=UPI002AD29BEF|nr:protocadherin Fat 4 [Cololabis saira]